MGGVRRETEVKLTVRNPANVRRQLRRQGFCVQHPRQLEQNVLFDTPGRDLRRRGCMLRLRSVKGQHWLTFKGAVGRTGRYKVREESETELADVCAARRILAGLGFQPVFRYEKYRTVYRGRGQSGEVMLDETPIGDFVQLEGPPGWIRRLARMLGAGPHEFITQNYAELYADWCRRTGRRPTHMTFSRPRRVSP